MAVIKKSVGPDGAWNGHWMFWCPGCDCAHVYKVVPPEPTWTFDGNEDKPTFMPSLKCTWPELDEDDKVIGQNCCHLFVRDGMIQYCGDCTHELAGKTVPMVDRY